MLYSAVAGLLEQRSFQSLMLPAWAMLAMAWFLLSHASLATSGSATISLRRVLLLTMLAAGLSIGAWCWGWWIPATALILGPLLGGGTRMTAQFIDETRQRRFLPLRAFTTGVAKPDDQHGAIRSRDLDAAGRSTEQLRSAVHRPGRIHSPQQ